MPTLTRFRLNDARPLLLAGLVALLAGPAGATEGQGRYTIQPTEGGVVRLDRETGAMSFCSGAEGNWTCKAMPETEGALKKRIEELEADKRALEAERRLRDGTPGPTAKAPDATEQAPPAGELAPPPPPGDLPVPTEKDVDKLFDYVEGMV